jgi:hypothetical protein
MSSTKNKDEDYAYTTAAINHLLVKANCPDKFRPYIFSLIGLANKTIEFEASDKQIATFARGRVEGGNVHADKGWARDKRRELVTWQDEGNLEIVKVEVRDYDSKTRRRPPTKYTLNILEYAEQVVAQARQHKLLWSGNHSMAIQFAAEHVVTNLLGQQVNTPKDKFIDPPSEVVAMLKTARRNLLKAGKMLKKYNFQLMRWDERQLRAMDKYMKSIRDRGFVDDPLDAIIFSGIKKDEP